MTSYYRLMEPEDLEQVLSLNLREADKDEIAASTGDDPVEALCISIEVSDRVWVVVHKGKIEGVFGVTRLEDRGIPWFLATDKFSEFRFSFAKESRQVVRQLLDEYGLLINLVDSRHKESIRWLRWLGFTVNEDTPVLLRDPEVPFYYFYMMKEGDDNACAPPLRHSN